MTTLALGTAFRQTIPSRMYACIGCLAPYWVKDGEHDPEYCPACVHSQAQAEAVRLRNDVLDLRRGAGVFADLTPTERTEQLAAMGIGYDVGSPVRQAIEDRMEDEARCEVLDAEEAERWDGMA